MKLTLIALALIVSTAAVAEEHILRDSMGRQTGRIVTDSKGNVTMYDAMGRQTGRAVTDSNGNTTTYDAMGRQTGGAAPVPTTRSIRAGTCLCHGVPTKGSRSSAAVRSFGATPGVVNPSPSG